MQASEDEEVAAAAAAAAAAASDYIVLSLCFVAVNTFCLLQAASRKMAKRRERERRKILQIF